jgi:hypothetical protein
MAEEEPVVRRCQHCPTNIEKVPQSPDWWRTVGARGALICDPKALDLKHKPLPVIR